MLPLLLLCLEVQSTPLPHDSYTASLPQTSAEHTTMADFRIFVTAASADFKVINEMLVYLRDWEDGSGDTFYLQTNNTIEESLKTSEEPVAIPVAVPGNFTAESFDTNAWAGASMAEVETFAIGSLSTLRARRLMSVSSSYLMSKVWKITLFCVWRRMSRRTVIM